MAENEQYKKAFNSLKTIDEIEMELDKRQAEMKADNGIFSEEDAQNVLKTGEPLIIKTEENGIPDAVLDVESAKKFYYKGIDSGKRELRQHRNLLMMLC